MKRVNIQRLKENFPDFIADLERGLSYLLCRRNVPIAELRPVRKISRKPRKFGQHLKAFEFNYEKFEQAQYAEDFQAPIFVHEKK